MPGQNSCGDTHRKPTRRKRKGWGRLRRKEGRGTLDSNQPWGRWGGGLGVPAGTCVGVVPACLCAKWAFSGQVGASDVGCAPTGCAQAPYTSCGGWGWRCLTRQGCLSAVWHYAQNLSSVSVSQTALYCIGYWGVQRPCRWGRAARNETGVEESRPGGDAISGSCQGGSHNPHSIVMCESLHSGGGHGRRRAGVQNKEVRPIGRRGRGGEGTHRGGCCWASGSGWEPL